MNLALYLSRVRSSDLLGGARRLRDHGLAKAQAIPVAIIYLEVATSVRLGTYIASDLDAPGPELCAQLINIVDPNIRIPCFAIRIHHPVWPHCARLCVLREHDDRPASRDHAK